MDYDTSLQLLRFLAAIATAAFGVFAIGAKTREDDGTLTRPGKIAVIGLAVAFLVTVLSQIVEIGKEKAASKETAKRLERLIRNSLYGSLSTRDAQLDMTLHLSLDAIQTVEPKYAKRLAEAHRNTSSCSQTTREVGIHKNHEFSCKGYTVLIDFLSGRAAYFDASSPLLPEAEAEPFAHALLSEVAIVLSRFDIGSEEPSSDSKTALFPFKKHSSSAVYQFDGSYLQMMVRGVRLETDELPNANLTSMVDFAGTKVSLHTSVFPLNCPDLKSPACERLREVLANKVELWRFALRFPHRRDLVFDRSGQLLLFSEKTSKLGFTYYTYTFPTNIEDFSVADRGDFRLR